MSLTEETTALLHAVHDLIYLGMDGTPVYSDDLSRRNREVYRLSSLLYDSGLHGATPEEEATVCLALLLGYNATFVDHGDKSHRIQCILERCWEVLDCLPGSLLKLRLLTACYGEVFEESLAEECRSIIASWNPDELTPEQREAVEEFNNVLNNPYPWEYIDEN